MITGSTNTPRRSSRWITRLTAPALHPSPHRFPFSARGLSDDEFADDAGFWEMYEHGRRVLLALDRLRDAVDEDWTDVSRADELIDFIDGWKRTQEMQGLYLAVLQATMERRSGQDLT